MRQRLFAPLHVLAAACTGLAAWVTVGALAVADRTSGTRLGLLPLPRYGVLAFVVLAAIVTALRYGRAVRPLLVPVLILLPWLPVPVPAVFLAWAGPLEWWVWAATLAAVGAVTLPRARGREAWITAPRSAGVVAGIAAALLFGGAWAVSKVPPSGDEPHYLLIAQSLLRDHDVRVDNNYASRDYLAYYPGELRTHVGKPGRHGQVYSVHAPGLPVLIAPAFAAAGYRGVVAFLVLVSALGTVFVWRAGFALTRSAGAAWFGWAAVTLSAPVLFQGSAVYPDPVAGVIVAGVLLSVLSREDTGSFEPGAPPMPKWTTRSFFVLGTTSAALPWLHTRLFVLAVVLLALLAWQGVRRRPRERHLAALFAPALLVIGSWLAFFWVTYGAPNPSAPYGARAPLEITSAPRALLALFVDQEFGVLPNAPVFGVALVGIASLLRLHARLAVSVIAIAVPYLAIVCSYAMWWGGWSSPARFAVPVLFVLGVAAAAFWSRASSYGRAVGATLLGLSALISATLVLGGDRRLAFNVASGRAFWLDWVAPLVDLPAGFPSAFRAGPPSLTVGALTWTAIGTISFALAWILDRRLRPTTGGRAVVAPLWVALALGAGITVSWHQAAVDPLRATRAQLALVQAAHDRALRVAVSLDPPRLLTRASLLPQLSVTVPPSSSGEVAPTDTLLELTGVPAGTYALEVPRRVGGAGELSLLIGNSTAPLERWTVSGDQTDRHRVTFPLRIGVLRVTLERRTTAREFPTGPAEVVLRPIDVPTTPLPTDLAGRAAVRYGQVTVYTTDERVSLERTGMWVLGGRRPTVVLAPGSPRRSIRLLLRNGPVPNDVRLSSRQWSTRAVLASNGEQEVEVPIAAGDTAVALVVEVTGGFRPADFDRASRDRRFLGCWIETR